MANPWRSLDPRISKSASALGVGPLKQLLFLKIPILIPSILAASAIGISVSIAQFLPTLFVGAGRISTLTTEVIALSYGSDRRILGVVATLQALVPWIAYAGAFFISRYIYNNRSGLVGISSMSLILEEITISLKRGKKLIDGLSLSVAHGEIFTVMGPSGSGKSTLLDAVGGNLGKNFDLKGELTLNEQDLLLLPPEKRNIGLLYQDAILFPHLSVGENLAFGLKDKKQGRAKRRAEIDKALWQAGLDGFYDRDPATLSGGQRSRAALMRTLLSEPAALLLDEPFSKLDLDMRDEIRSFVFSSIYERDIPALMVTHDPSDAVAANGPSISIQVI